MNQKVIHAQAPDRIAVSSPKTLQRACACGQHAECGECAACKQRREGLLQRAAIGTDLFGTTAPPIVHDVLRSPGQPLDGQTRAYMEPRFGHDFSGVRVHTDGQATASTKAVNARAYTVGSDVVFGAGEYEPQRVVGKHLIAHELAHVIQQRHSPNDAQGMDAGAISDDRSAETSARDTANQVLRGNRVNTTANSIGHSIQMSQLSDDLTRIWRDSAGNKGQIFDRLRAASPCAGDSDVTAFISRTFAGQPDDLWLAQTIQQNGPEPLWPSALLDQRHQLMTTHQWAPEPGNIGASLGTTAGNRSVQAYYFIGQTSQRALIIGGVHGSEQSGIEVAELLIADLLRGPRPYFTVIIVPELFPDNAAAAKASHQPPNADSNVGRYTGGRNLDPNRNFPQPGTSLGSAKRDSSGHSLDAQGVPIQRENAMLLHLVERFQPSRIASLHGNRTESASGIFADPHTTAAGAPASERQAAQAATKKDADLATQMARRAATGGARVAGNRLDTTPNALYPLQSQGGPGVTLGTYGPRAVHEGGAQDRPALTVITVEVFHFHRSSTEKTPQAQAQRLRELQTHRTALREIFLAPP